MTIIALTLLLAGTAPCPGSTTREVERCPADDLARADAELNRYYAAAVRRLTDERQPTVLAKLRASERTWIRHRDGECDAVWEYWKGGTIRGTFSTKCRIRLTRGRTAAIWSNWLTYVDSTPPLLSKRKRPLITVDGINRNEGLTFGCRSAHPARGVACDLAKAHLVVENGKAARFVHLLR